MKRFHPDDSYNQHEERPNISQSLHCNEVTPQFPLQKELYRLGDETENVMKTTSANPKEDQFNESLITLLNGQQDKQKQSLNMLQDMTCRHDYDNLMRDILIYNGKNIKLADWLLQIGKVALSTNSQECELATAKLMSAPYKMLKRMHRDRNWQYIKKKLEVYSPIVTEVHSTSNLHRKQRPEETLQEYIQNCTGLIKSHGSIPS